MVLSVIQTKHFAPLGAVSSVKKTERGLLLKVGEERFRADVLRADVICLKISQAGIFDESPTFAASFAMPELPPFEVVETADTVVLTTECLRLVISKRSFGLDAYRSDGSVLFEDERDEAGSPCGYLQLNDSFIVTRR